MIVCGVADHALRERLLRVADQTLEKAIDAGILLQRRLSRNATCVRRHKLQLSGSIAYFLYTVAWTLFNHPAYPESNLAGMQKALSSAPLGVRRPLLMASYTS
jgi:hypothetical protein